MPVTPIPRVSANAFHKKIAFGRSKPDVVNCVNTQTGAADYFVVKLTSAMELGASTLANEVIGSHMASLLGVQTPIAAVVDVSAAFAATIEDPFDQARYKKSQGLNFGSEYLIGGWATWPAEKIIGANLRQTCLEVFAFDALLQNSDRKVDNPNLLYRGEDVMLYDHELTFSNYFLIGPPEKKALKKENLDFMRKHVFYSALKGGAVDLTRMEGALSAVDAAGLAAIKADVPPPWQGPSLDPILGYLAELTANPNRLTRVVQELLA